MNPWVRLLIALALALPMAAGRASADDNPPAGSGGQSAQGSAPTPPSVSIMFSPDEVAAIEKAIADHEHPPAQDIEQARAAAAAAEAIAAAGRPHVPNIYVSAVLDFGGGDWTVWANGLRITPGQQPPLFHVTSVNGNTVEIVVPAEGNARVRLQPYQTWRSDRREIVEGIVP